MDFEARRAARHMPQGATETAYRAAGPIIQAAIAAQYVTGTPEWDRLLTIIQAELEVAKQAKQSCETAIMARNLTDPNELMQIKINALIASERINVLNAVIALPSEIIKDANAARINLEKLSNE